MKSNLPSQQGLSDKALGGAMMAAAATVFVYYTTWAILVPFFDASSPIHAWFPPREWAIRLPAFILVIGLSAIGAFVGSTIIKENRKQAQKAKLRAA
ncbi:dolichol phosphate-mannose biosynthesis regulatory [Lactarius quietus]|nr:dolichol phosphate-mannose biosynthesis regulatory [Lactarius quietus]